MTKRENTIRKEREVMRVFHSLLRSGKDYTTEYMYKEAGSNCFLSIRGTGEIVRRYYRNVIDTDMIMFIANRIEEKRSERIEQFAIAFDMCIRESALVMRYILGMIKTED